LWCSDYFLSDIVNIRNRQLLPVFTGNKVLLCRECQSTSFKYVPTIGAGKTCANRYQWIVCFSCLFLL
jgi:hypothetical protein